MASAAVSPAKKRDFFLASEEGGRAIVPSLLAPWWGYLSSYLDT